MGDLSEHFSREEFACECGCGFDAVNPGLVDVLEWVRSLSGGVPLVINSGCRCPNHNAESGGVPNSPHLRGNAVDIAVEGGKRRYDIVKAAILGGALGVGVAKTYVHIDVDDDTPRPAIWTY